MSDLNNLPSNVGLGHDGDENYRMKELARYCQNSRIVLGNHVAFDSVSTSSSVLPSGLPYNEFAHYRVRDYSHRSNGDRDLSHAPDNLPTYHSRHSSQSRDIVMDRLEPQGYSNGVRQEDPQLDDIRDVDYEITTLRRPIKLRLGQKGQVRFFVVRSFSWFHVYDSMNDGTWATHRDKTDMLGELFSRGMTVVLFFSVNKSHGFQGYALMKSEPSRDVRRPRWWYNMNVSEPFKVEWMNTTHVDSSHVSDITDSLNHYLPVTRARNCQEVDDTAGRQMLTILESRAVDKFKRAKRA
ncbi:YT521-B-like domain-containing protein [Jackrogersella minutella]|nr:YT521-B-like domain-containing protein [Jackrogersella minutella]